MQPTVPRRSRYLYFIRISKHIWTEGDIRAGILHSQKIGLQVALVSCGQRTIFSMYLYNMSEYIKSTSTDSMHTFIKHRYIIYMLNRHWVCTSSSALDNSNEHSNNNAQASDSACQGGLKGLRTVADRRRYQLRK